MKNLNLTSMNQLAKALQNDLSLSAIRIETIQNKLTQSKGQTNLAR